MIDLGPARPADLIAAEVDRACVDTGFFLVAGHDIPAELVAEMHRVSSEFFDQPESYKACYAREGTSRGYVPFETESLAATVSDETVSAHRDLKEAFAVGRQELTYGPAPTGSVPVSWPDRPVEFRDVWQRYYLSVHTLSERLMGVFASALGIPTSFFGGMMARSVDFLRAIGYPALAEPPPPHRLRAGAHTDFGALTVLCTDTAEGLQVRMPAGDWVDVPYMPGTFVVNIGDMMAHWTNYRWRSTAHRVVVPDLPRPIGRRQSIVFFHNPNLDAVVRPITGDHSAAQPGNPVVAGEWLRDKALRQRSAAARS